MAVSASKPDVKGQSAVGVKRRAFVDTTCCSGHVNLPVPTVLGPRQAAKTREPGPRLAKRVAREAPGQTYQRQSLMDCCLTQKSPTIGGNSEIGHELSDVELRLADLI
jgi:hypothetical protein